MEGDNMLKNSMIECRFSDFIDHLHTKHFHTALYKDALLVTIAKMSKDIEDNRIFIDNRQNKYYLILRPSNVDICRDIQDFGGKKEYLALNARDFQSSRYYIVQIYADMTVNYREFDGNI
jgi:hypothetical protein